MNDLDSAILPQDLRLTFKENVLSVLSCDGGDGHALQDFLPAVPCAEAAEHIAAHKQKEFILRAFLCKVCNGVVSIADLFLSQLVILGTEP